MAGREGRGKGGGKGEGERRIGEGTTLRC